MKNFFYFIALTLASSSVFAQSETTCQLQTEQRLKLEASNTTDWAFEGLQLVPQVEVSELIDSALTEDNSLDQLQALKAQAQLPENESFVLRWTAPSNSGSTLLVVNKTTCSEVAQLLLYSEE